MSERVIARDHYPEELSDLVEASLQVAREIVRKEGADYVAVFRELVSTLPFKEFTHYYDPEAYTGENTVSGQRRLSEFRGDGMRSNTEAWMDVLPLEDDAWGEYRVHG